MSEEFSCTEQEEPDGSVRVRAAGELDAAEAPRLREVLRRSEEAGRDVLLDLSDLSFIDLSGLHVIEEAADAARRDGIGFAIAGPVPKRGAAGVHRGGRRASPARAPGASGGEPPGLAARGDVGEPAVGAADRDRAFAAADQSSGERDQTAADEDQTGSDRDQEGSDADQTGSDRDQAAADRDQRGGRSRSCGPRRWPGHPRRRIRAQPAGAPAQRPGTGRHGRRARACRRAARSHRGPARRNRRASATPRQPSATSRRDERDRLADLGERSGSAEQAARRARRDRQRAQMNREQAARDREQAAHDREQAARDRNRRHATATTRTRTIPTRRRRHVTGEPARSLRPRRPLPDGALGRAGAEGPRPGRSSLARMSRRHVGAWRTEGPVGGAAGASSVRVRRRPVRRGYRRGPASRPPCACRRRTACAATARSGTARSCAWWSSISLPSWSVSVNGPRTSSGPSR